MFRWVPLDKAARAPSFGSQRHLIIEVRREFGERMPHPALRIEPTPTKNGPD